MNALTRGMSNLLSISKLFRTPKQKQAATTPLLIEEDEQPIVENHSPKPSNKPAKRHRRIGLVGFHDHGFIIARPTSPYSPWLTNRAQDLQNCLGGMTNITDGLRCAFNLLLDSPRNDMKTIWLLSNAAPNREKNFLFPMVHECRDVGININTIGIGRNYDNALLKEISATSYAGCHYQLDQPRGLSNILTKIQIQPNFGNRRGETIVVLIDCSHSMTDKLGTHSKVSEVEDALVDFIYHQKRVRHLH